MNSASIWQPFVLALPVLLIGAFSFFKLMKARQVNLLRVLVVAFALHFGLVPLYAFSMEWLAGSWLYTAEEVWAAYLNNYAFLGGLLLVLFLYDLSAKRFRRSWSIPALLEFQYQSISPLRAGAYFLVVMGFLLGYNIYFGYTHYASGSLERNLSVPYPMVVLKSFATIFVFGLMGYGALHLIRGKKWMLLGVLLLSSNILLDWYARRNYVYAIVVLVLFKLLLDHFRIRLSQVLVVGVGAFLLLQVFFPFLYVFRLLTAEAAHAKKDATDINRIYEQSQGARGYLIGKEEDANVAYRANSIARNIELMKLPGEEGRYMNGLLFASQVAMVVPRALNPAKIETSGKSLSPERMVLFFYGRKEFDLSDNLPIYGFLEFGYLGALLVGLLQGLLLVVFEWFAFRFQRIHPFLGLSVLMYALYSHLNLEYPYSQELSMLREMLLFFLIVWPFSLLRGVFSKKPARRRLSTALE